MLNLAGLLVVAVVLLVPVQAGSAFTLAPHSAAGPVAAHATSVASAHATPSPTSSLPLALRTSVLDRVNGALHASLALPASSLGPVPTSSAETGAVGAAPTPATSTNSQLPGSDCASWGLALYVPFFGGENTVQVGSSASDLLAGASTTNDMFNGTGGTPCVLGLSSISPTKQFFANGLSATWSSTDGGATWVETATPRNISHWQTSGDATFGSITTGPTVVTADASGDANVVTGYAGACLIDPLLNCSAPSGLQAPWGFAISHSSDSGATWTNATQLDQEIALKYINFAASCSAFGLVPGYYVNNLPERPWIVQSGSSVVAGWDVFHENWDAVNCTRLSQAFVQVVSSTDAGATWSSPLNISNPVSDSVGLAIGPAPSNTVYGVFADFLNATSTGQYSWAFVKSTNGGATWTTESDMGPAFVNPGGTTSPDAFATAQFPNLAADSSSTSPYSGNLYLVWQDNQSGSYAGYEAIGYLRSTNGGATWGTVAYLTPQTTGTTYFQPSIAVGPDGTVWVTYLGVSTSSGNYELYGVYSKDGGVTWSHQFQVSDTASAPGTSVIDIGFNMGVAATSAGAVPIWPDCRASTCLTNGDVTLMTAQVADTNVTTNAPGAVSVSVTAFGSTSSYTLPAKVGWDAGASITAQAPQTLPYNATYVDAFAGWAGASTSGNYRTTFTYSGSGNLTALYSPVPAAFFAGNITPNVAGVALTLNGQPVTLTPSGAQLTYTVSVASGGAYWLNASAPLYVGQQVLRTALGGQTIYVNFDLVKQTGTITGTLNPPTAALTLDDASVTASVNTTSKIFTLVVPWGSHWLNASYPGYTSQSAYLSVTAGGVVTHNFFLTGGWISGAVKGWTSGLVLKVDGAAQTTTSGTFNVSVAGGTHNLTATQKGYNLSVIENIAVMAGRTTFVNVTLTNFGWLTGTIAPVAALAKSLELKISNGTLGGPQQYNAQTGVYNVSLQGLKNWTITVSANGYNTSTTSGYVTPGNTTTVDVTLSPSVTPPCTVNCTPPGGGGGTSSSSLPLTTIGIIVAVIVIVAIAALVLLMRRRGGGGSGGGDEVNQSPPDQVYEGSSPSELPKLQSDGSMGGPPNP